MQTKFKCLKVQLKSLNENLGFDLAGNELSGQLEAKRIARKGSIISMAAALGARII